jgi:hypothetical protein
MDMLKEHKHPMNHRLEVEDMDMVGIHMVEVGGYGYGEGALPLDEPSTRDGGY